VKTQSITLNWNNRKGILAYLLLGYYIYIVLIYITQGKYEGRAAFASGSSIVWLLLTLLYMLEVPKYKAFINNHGKLLGRFFLILQPILSFLMIEMMVSNYNLKMFRLYGLYNLVWYYAISLLFFVFLRNIRLTVHLSNLLVYLAGVLNYLIYLFRGNPIIPSDLLAWQTGMSVASNYQVNFTTGFILATLIMFFVLVIGSKLGKEQVKLSLMNRGIVIGAYSILLVMVYFLFYHTDLIETKIKVIDFFAPKYTYRTYGTAFGFVANVEAMNAEEPEGYSSELVRETLSDAQKKKHLLEKNNPLTEKEPLYPGSDATRPNIIAIMSEAYSDLSMIADYETNISYKPYTSTLEENTTKGTMYSSVYGGATSDTEYEFLTGNSMAVMPRNSVPYQQFITEETDSLAAILKAQGYYNIAIHPFEPSGYKRDLVYPLLGFDEFLSEEDFQSPHMIRSYISDRDSYQKIIEQYEAKKDQPLFIFNVTMQNHGGYSAEQLFDEQDTVRLTRLTGFPKVEQYLSLIRESDKAFQTLVDYFSKVEEPTIILLFGDHQPAVYSELPKQPEERKGAMTAETELKRYKVPFLIWANYDIKEDDVQQISANYLSSYLLETAGLEGTAYQDFLLQLRKELPVINAHFYITMEGKCFPLAEETSYSEKLRLYQYVGYNNALDNKNKLWEYYRIEPKE
jgi:phosphoglycerol transferase MdoB-like AlkP superfamily enzyme